MTSNGADPAGATANPTHLEPSELGTREYPSPNLTLTLPLSSSSWDALYETEIANHAADPSDTGTNWFDDSGAQDKVLEFLAEHFATAANDEEAGAEGKAMGKDTASFLDLGTGNGDLLFGLREHGWRGRALGVDYSERSVEFARRREEARQERFRGEGGGGEEEEEEEGEGNQHGEDEDEVEEAREPVEFARHDILAAAGPDAAVVSGAQAPAGARGGWDVVLDKGTFDAISLSAATDARGRRINEGYRGRVLPLVRPGGLFLITSCNWTEEELERWFAGPQHDDGEAGAGGAGARGWGFDVVDRIQYRTFSFGGVKGQTISSVCFRKVARE
ncbi:uncharacterized protein JN550_006636 [Neoarthrinium moseri]|uniref:uncharacterized protein n=1 Tax=Neoarthrinium moseri TaxID=1658444 RepID=UPI001FDBD387|nr:uncharacterized protein JN550_006636 [Neoarthrinium moseri]KAI1868148.1 hypothetical protein JN550_006636 [Neoarthrinium moseri]